MKYDIDFAVEPTNFDGKAKPIDIYFFYVDGKWDGHKLTLKEARRKYPLNEYNWNKVF